VKTIPPLLLADLRKDLTCLAFLWTIEMANGKMIRGTEHDLDITLGDSSSDSPADKYAGTYYAVANVTAGDIASTSDLSVDNLEMTGAMPQAPYTQIPDVTVEEVEAGLLDMAPVTVLICNWQAPSHGYFAIKTGFLGDINRDSDGKYITEVRGLTQLLSQIIIRTFSATCNVVKFGDRRCKFNVAAITITGSVVAVTNRQEFSVDLAQASPRPLFSYVGGTLTFTSGANLGFSREVKLDPNENAGVIELWEDFPGDVLPGDAYDLSPGCDRQPLTCIHVYHNFNNWRGYGIFIPGLLELLAGPAKVAQL
jgi:uncharacterized phage protein (TIGR02218 family)